MPVDEEGAVDRSPEPVGRMAEATSDGPAVRDDGVVARAHRALEAERERCPRPDGDDVLAEPDRGDERAVSDLHDAVARRA